MKSCREMMDEMLPFLTEIGIKGKQVDRTFNSESNETREWLHHIYTTVFREVLDIDKHHPRATWNRIKIYKLTKLHEAKVRRAALKKLYKTWYERRPIDISPPPAGQRRQFLAGEKVIQRKGRKKKNKEQVDAEARVEEDVRSIDANWEKVTDVAEGRG